MTTECRSRSAATAPREQGPVALPSGGIENCRHRRASPRGVTWRCRCSLEVDARAAPTSRSERRSLPALAERGQVTGGLLTADEVAALLSVPKSWVYEQSRLGRIPTVTLGRYRRYRREAIE